MKRLCMYAAWSVLILAGVLATVSADTIYLKDGNVIKAFVLEQTKEKVTFIRYGGTITMSMNRVDRIVKDSHGTVDEEKAKRSGGEQQPRRFEGSFPPGYVPPDVAGRGPETAFSSPPPGVFSDEELQEAGAPPQTESPESVEEDETKTPEYWQNLKLTLEKKIEEKKKKLNNLEIDRRGRARLFMNTTDIREEIERVKKELADLEAQYRELPEKARRAGVPPGWLR